MQIEKTTIIRIKTTDGREVNLGDTVVFSAGGRNIIGIFIGIGRKGSWEFDGVAHFENIHFTVAPKAIQRMFLADVNVRCDEMERLNESTDEPSNLEESED